MNRLLPFIALATALHSEVVIGQKPFYYQLDVPLLLHRLEEKTLRTAVADWDSHIQCFPDTTTATAFLISDGPIAMDEFMAHLTGSGIIVHTVRRTDEEEHPLEDPLHVRSASTTFPSTAPLNKQ